jgi:hypothetical protein
LSLAPLVGSKIDQELRKNSPFVRGEFQNRRSFAGLASIPWWLGFCVDERGRQGGRMASELISYAPLVVIFVVTGLRMFVDKPNQTKSMSLRPWREMLRRTNRRYRS